MLPPRHSTFPLPTANFRLVTLDAPRLIALEPGGPPRTLVGTGKPLALVTFLAMSPQRSATRDRVCDLLWGDRELDDARVQLRQTRWLLHGKLGVPVVRGTTILELAAPIASDADHFVRAVASGDYEVALDLYHADFFAAFASTGTERFEEWAAVERARLRALFVHATESVARAHLDRGRFTEAAAAAMRLRELDPAGEVAWRLLLEARLSAGDPIGVLAAADAFESWISAEGHEPDASSRALLKQARRATPKSTAAQTSTDLPTELVGRARAFAVITEAWGHAQSGQGQRLHLSGGGGIGKSRLLQDVANRLRAARQRVVVVRANIGERHIPFAFAGAVAAALAALPGAAGVSSGSAEALVNLNPALSSAFPRVETALGSPDARRSGFALQELLAAVADESAIALFLDDLHWADPASRDVLAVVSAHLDKHPVLVITTSRPHVSGGETPAEATEVELASLTTPDVEQLVSSIARIPDASWGRELPGRLAGCARGNPLLVLEALRLCLESGVLARSDGRWHCPDPQGLETTLREQAVLARRLSGLDNTEQRLMLVLALAGAPLAISMVAAALGAAMDVVERARPSLEHRGLVTSSRDTLTAAHDEIARAVIDLAPADDVQAVRAGLGAALANASEPDVRRRALPHLAQSNQWRTAADVVARAFAERPVSARTLEREVGALLGDAMSQPRLTEIRRRLPFRLRYPRARRATMAAGGIALIGTIVTGVVASRGRIESDVMLAVAVPVADGFRVQMVPLNAEAWDATQPLVVSRGGDRWPLFNGGYEAIVRPGHREWAVETVSPDSGEFDVELRGPKGRVKRLTSFRSQDRPMTFSPDGEQLVFATTRWSALGRSSLAVLNLRSGGVRRLTTPAETDVDARWSIDGSRIVFVRMGIDSATAQLCLIDADGTHESCQRLPNGAKGFAGWCGTDCLIMRFSSPTGGSYAGRLDLATAVVTPLPLLHGEATTDPLGRWVLARTDKESGRRWTIAPVFREQLAREIETEGPGTLVSFATSPSAGRYVDRIVIEKAPVVVAGVPYRLNAHEYTRSGAVVNVAVRRWRALTPSATIDSTGVLLARDTGDVLVEVSTGGWRTATETLHVVSRRSRVLMMETWDAAAFQRWAPFGRPFPILTVASDGTSALLNNGDGYFFSGVHLRQPADADSGLAFEVALSTPITANQWQYIDVSLQTLAKPTARALNTLGRWDHRTGYLTAGLSEIGSCGMPYPTGEGPAARYSVRDPRTDGPLFGGHWWTARVQILPDGRCGVAINGVAVLIDESAARGATIAVLQGSSVGTRMLVGPVTLLRGVPNDVDWTQLREITPGHWRRVAAHGR